jgi:CheY-like chemotaxis protein
MPEALRLLFIEDCVEDAFLATHALKRAGVHFEARVVDDEPGLTHALGEWPPDLIVCDFTLPRFDGFAALEVCRGNASQIPFLFRSGTIGPQRAAEAIRRGAHGAIEKGDNDAFVQFVRRVSLDLLRGQSPTSPL